MMPFFFLEVFPPSPLRAGPVHIMQSPMGTHVNEPHALAQSHRKKTNAKER